MIYYGNILIIVMLVYYTMFYINVFLTGYENVQYTNIKLNDMRKISVKSLEQQKDFLNLKYPKKQKIKKHFWDYYFIFIMFTITISIYMLYNYVFNVFKLHLNLTIGILFVIVFPIILNIILLKFNLDNNDLVNLFKK